jgi:hypothetical protein
MPEVRYTGGGHYRVDGYGFDAGDVHDVGDELFGYLEAHEDFEVVGDAGDDGVHEEDPLEGKSVAEVDVSEHLDRWLDQPYDHRAEQVRGGGVDDSLDAIEDAETSQTVIDAVEERRDKLEG